MKTKADYRNVPSEREYIAGMAMTGIIILVIALAIAVTVTWYTTKSYEVQIHQQAMRTATFLPMIIVPACVSIVGLQGLANHRRMLAVTRLAHTDEMTGLANRRAFMQEAHSLFEATDLDYEGLCIFIVDLDHFKKVNDAYGHEAGDEVLIHASTLLIQAVPHGSLVARLGGEEFAVLMHYTSMAQIHERAEAIRYRIASSICTYQEHRIRISASVGVGIAHPRDTVSSVMSRADNALYAAKDEGRNRFVVAA
ncbi:MAG: GGDEF domain-containing protein [Pseudomonadota bacterium]